MDCKLRNDTLDGNWDLGFVVKVRAVYLEGLGAAGGGLNRGLAGGGSYDFKGLSMGEGGSSHRPPFLVGGS